MPLERRTLPLLVALLAFALPPSTQAGPHDGRHATQAERARDHRDGDVARRLKALPRPARDADFRDGGRPDRALVTLGNLLFFDKILSGNRNISCATCHHALTDTGDGLSLPVGEGARGLGVTRDTGTGADAVVERVPRNAPALFNLGALEFTRMFHDGRVEEDPAAPSGFATPAGAQFPAGLDSVLAAQAMFPVTSATEMAGQPGENAVADAAAAGDLAGPAGVWALLADRLRTIPGYVAMFVTAFDDVHAPADIRFVHAANAIAAFEAAAWRADDSPFDRFLRGDRHAMSLSAQRGMRLFYGRARCAGCHRGTFQTDHDFHAIAMPQIGPGKGDGVDGLDDFGRERVTGDSRERYRFRTPSLRNVLLTGPWGHDGAYDSLRGVIEHHLDPAAALDGYDTTQAVLTPRPDLDALDFVVHGDPARRAALAAASELGPARGLSAHDVDDLVSFLEALTDAASVDLRRDVPLRLPSALPLAD